MDERSRPSGSSSAGPEQSSSCRSVAGGHSATSVLSMSMASVSSEESVEVFPLAEQEEIAALTHDVRIFKESLEKLRRTFNTVDRDKHEAMRVAAHDRLGDVFRILRTVLEKYPSLHSTELLQTAGTLVQSVKGYNYEDESLESKDILGTIEQLALAFSSRVSEYLMGDFDSNFSLSSSVSSAKTKSCDNLDSDAESIPDVHIVDKKPDLLSPQEIDSMLLKLEQGVDFALNRAKLWAKYARDVIMYIERRTHLDLEYAKNLNKLANTFGPSIKSEPNLPLQSIYCTLLENDEANSIASQATCSIVLGNKYLEPLSARRNEHEQSRKRAKELWHRKLTQMHSAISCVRRARASYQDDQAEWEKTRDALLRTDPSDQQYEKKKIRGDEALQRVGQTRFHLSQHFDSPKGMIFLSDRVKPGIGGATLPGRKPNLSPGTFPRGESIEQPAWLAFDNQILTFDAFFQETAQEREYNHQIRPCKIFFYPQDGTMLVTEPKTANSGMSQGTLMSRHRIPYPAPKDSEFFNILDLNIGREIEIYGRFFKIVNCDLFTRNYLNRCGIPVPDPINMPEDPYSKMRLEKEGKKYAKHPTHTVHKLRQFLLYDRQVLSFKGYWDDQSREGGFVHLLKLNYYLSDDTIEIFEIFAPGLSQESGSTFLGKCKLPKVLESETGYKASIVDTNEKRIQLLKTKTEVVQKTRELILESDAVIKTATVAYFQGQYNLTSMWPHQVKTLCDRSKLYEPGSQYMEFVKRLQPNQNKETAPLPFSFDPASNSETSQVLGKERKSTDSLDSEDLLCENFYLIDSARSVRSVQDSNSFQNAQLNSTLCSECGSNVTSHTVDCSECGSSCRKKSSRMQNHLYGRRHIQEKMSIFGVDLAQHLAETQSCVPQIVCKCVDHINERGKLIKGIYRLSGVKSRVEKLCQEFEQEAESVDLTDVHPNVIASVLKLYLRQLPEPLLTFQLYNDFIQIAKDCPSGSDVDVELKFVMQLTEIVSKLPRAHYLTASYLLHHLQEVAASSAVNHMPATNLGIVFGPTVLRTVEGSASLSSLVDTIHQTRVVELLVSHVGEIFGSTTGKSSSPLTRSSTSMYPNCEVVEISGPHTHPEENLQDHESSLPASKEQSYELTSDEELSYFLLDDQSSSLKASSSSSTPKIFQGSLKDYQGLEGVSLTLLGDTPADGKSRVQEKLRKTVSASAVDAWHPRPQPQKPRNESLGGMPELSQCTGSSADSDYSFESRASSLESTEVFVETPSVMSHSIEVQCPASVDSQNVSNSKQQYSAYIPVYQTHSDSSNALNIVRTKSFISETKVIRDLLKRQFLDYKEVKISVPHMSMACVQSSFKKTSFNGSSSIQTNVDVQMEADSQPSLSMIPTASADNCTPVPGDDIETLEISPDKCVPYVSFENDDTVGEEHTSC